MFQSKNGLAQIITLVCNHMYHMIRSTCVSVHTYWSKPDKEMTLTIERMYAREDMNIEAAQAAEGGVFNTEIHLQTLGWM